LAERLHKAGAEFEDCDEQQVEYQRPLAPETVAEDPEQYRADGTEEQRQSYRLCLRVHPSQTVSTLEKRKAQDTHNCTGRFIELLAERGHADTNTEKVKRVARPCEPADPEECPLQPCQLP
jgi:hypothetical protein